MSFKLPQISGSIGAWSSLHVFLFPFVFLPVWPKYQLAQTHDNLSTLFYLTSFFFIVTWQQKVTGSPHMLRVLFYISSKESCPTSSCHCTVYHCYRQSKRTHTDKQCILHWVAGFPRWNIYIGLKGRISHVWIEPYGHMRDHMLDVS